MSRNSAGPYLHRLSEIKVSTQLFNLVRFWDNRQINSHNGKKHPDTKEEYYISDGLFHGLQVYSSDREIHDNMFSRGRGVLCFYFSEFQP